MNIFERYLTLWVLLCIGAGIAIGQWLNAPVEKIARMEWHGVNLPVAVLIWLMIYPMMVRVDFGALRRGKVNLRGLGLTVGVNWLLKPFTMAFFAWVFFYHVFQAWISPDMAEQYLAGAILLGVAPCTAMVFVWSQLSSGDANYTLVQVAVNDLILLVAFVPLTGLLLGITDISVPYDVLLSSVVLYVVLPLGAGWLSRLWIVQKRGTQWLDEVFLARLKPVSIVALLLTLVLLFAYQGKQILEQPFVILLIAVPLIVQTYFIFFVTWRAGKRLCLPHNVCAPAGMIGASNFFELSVAVAIALFGVDSGAALATVVGVLIEVPVMLSLVRFAVRNKY